MKVAMQSFFFFPMLYAVGLCKLVCVALVPAAAAAAARTNLKKDKKHNWDRPLYARSVTVASPGF